MNSGEAAAIRAVHSRRLHAASLSEVLSTIEERVDSLIAEQKFSNVLADKEIKKLDQYRVSLFAEGEGSTLICKIYKLKLKATYCQIKVDLENTGITEQQKVNYLLFELKKLYNNYSQTQVRDSVIKMIYLELVPEASQSLSLPESLCSEQQNSDTVQTKIEEKNSKKPKRVLFNDTVEVKLFKPRELCSDAVSKNLPEPKNYRAQRTEDSVELESVADIDSSEFSSEVVLVEPEHKTEQETGLSLEADSKNGLGLLKGHDEAMLDASSAFSVALCSYSKLETTCLNNNSNLLGRLSAEIYLQQAKQFQSQIALLTSQQTEIIENTDQVALLQLLVKGFCDIAIMAAKEHYTRCHKASENTVKALVQARKQLPKSAPVLRDSLGRINTAGSISDERYLGQVSRLEFLTAEMAEKEANALTQYVNLMIGLCPSGLRWSYSSQCLLKTLLGDAIKYFSDEQINSGSSNMLLEKIQESYRQAYKILFYHFKNSDYQRVVTHALNFRELTEKLSSSGYKKTFKKTPAVVEYRELTKIIEALAYCKLASEAVQLSDGREEPTLEQKNQAKEYFKLAVQALKDLKQIKGFPQTTAIKQYANTVLLPEIKRQLRNPETGLSLRSTEIFDDDIKNNIADTSRTNSSDSSHGSEGERGTIDLDSKPSFLLTSLMLETSEESVPDVVKQVFHELEVSWQDFRVEIAFTESSPQRNSRTSELMNKLSPSRRSLERAKSFLGLGNESNSRPHDMAPGPLIHITGSFFYDHNNSNEENRTGSNLAFDP